MNFPRNTCRRHPFPFINSLELFINVWTQEQLVGGLKTLHARSDWVASDAVASSGRHSVVRPGSSVFWRPVGRTTTHPVDDRPKIA
jgi:hypothetical protein